VKGEEPPLPSLALTVTSPGLGRPNAITRVQGGSDSGPGYITGGETLAAGSLQLNSSGAGWTGNIGSQPSHLCNSGCTIDTTTPIKIANASSAVLLGTWTTTGYSSSSLALSVPTTIRALTQPGELYRVDLVWTLNTGP
jgi:hypothetical protein